MITMLAPVTFDPSAAAPRFDRVVENLAGGDPAMIAYIRRIAGYTCTGLTSEQALFILYGDGNEGKSVFLEAIGSTLGDYAQQVPAQTLAHSRDGAIPNDIARMKGKRLARISELEKGMALAEAKIKQLTGGDRVVARFLRQEFFEFKPVCKIILDSNYLPRIRGSDRGIWRRIRVVRCKVPIPEAERDRRLAAKLVEEASGILAWIVRGAIEWQRDGLGEPEPVAAALEEYRSEMDDIGRFMEECIRVGAAGTAPCRDVYGRYVTWCMQNGEKTLSSREFAAELRARGFETRKSTGGCYRWEGLSIPATNTTVPFSAL